MYSFFFFQSNEIMTLILINNPPNKYLNLKNLWNKILKNLKIDLKIRIKYQEHESGKKFHFNNDINTNMLSQILEIKVFPILNQSLSSVWWLKIFCHITNQTLIILISYTKTSIKQYLFYILSYHCKPQKAKR